MTPTGLDLIARDILMFAGAEAVRALVLVAVMAAALLFMRRARAAARLGAWTVVLYGALALPLLGLVMPAWRWSMPAIQRTSLAAAAPASVTPGDSTASPVVAARAASATVESATPAAVSAPVILAAIYLGGVSWFAFQAVLGWFAARRLRRFARVIGDAAVLNQLARHAAAAGLGTPPVLVESAQIPAPVTTFVRRPIVALPEDWREWPAAQLDAVLIHELSHVARRDALTQRVALGYRALFWFSPVAWWLPRHVSRLAEHASDEAALGAGIDPASYADLLLGFFVRVRGQQGRESWNVAMARRADADAHRRIERILSWKGGPIMTRSKLFGIGIAILMTPLAALAASVRIAPEIVLPAVAPAAIGQVTPTPPLTTFVPIRQTATPPKAKPQAKPTPTPTPTPAAPKPTAPPPAAAPAGSQNPEDEFLKNSYDENTPGLFVPEPVRLQVPKYTPDGMRQKLQGSVEVEIVIAPDGTVTKARIKRSLDKASGLDDAALEAALKSTFTGGILNGQPVAVHAVIKLEFRLH